jgi:hypothetical protein
MYETRHGQHRRILILHVKRDLERMSALPTGAHLAGKGKALQQQSRTSRQPKSNNSCERTCMPQITISTSVIQCLISSNMHSYDDVPPQCSKSPSLRNESTNGPLLPGANQSSTCYEIDHIDSRTDSSAYYPCTRGTCSLRTVLPVLHTATKPMWSLPQQVRLFD